MTDLTTNLPNGAILRLVDVRGPVGNGRAELVLPDGKTINLGDESARGSRGSFEVNPTTHPSFSLISFKMNDLNRALASASGNQPALTTPALNVLVFNRLLTGNPINLLKVESGKIVPVHHGTVANVPMVQMNTTPVGTSSAPAPAAAAPAAAPAPVSVPALKFENLGLSAPTGHGANNPRYQAGHQMAQTLQHGGLMIATETGEFRSLSVNPQGHLVVTDIPLTGALNSLRAGVKTHDNNQIGKIIEESGKVIGVSINPHGAASGIDFPTGTAAFHTKANAGKTVEITTTGKIALVTANPNGTGEIKQHAVSSDPKDKHAFELMKGDPRKLDDAQKKEIADYIKRLEQESRLKLTAPATQAAGAAPPQNATPPRVEYKKYGPNGTVVFPAPPQPAAPAAPQPSAPPSRRPPPPAPEKSGEIRAETPTGSVTVSLADAAPHGAAAGAKPDQVAVAKAAGGSTPSAASDTTPT